MPPKRPPKTYQPPAWKQQREKQKQVQRWKTVGSYKKLLKREGAVQHAQLPAAAWSAAPEVSEDGATAERDGPSASVGAESSGGLDASVGGAAPAGKRKKSESAQALARKSFEVHQRDVEAERAEIRRAAAEVRQAKADAQKRRTELSAKFKKRTKRGQPVLSNQVDAILHKLGAS
jgi:hypothetical protein